MSAALWYPVALFAVGLASWPLVEYAVHGGLAHRLRTPVTHLHWAHHVGPHRVFTSPLAWVPLAVLLFAGAAAALGWAPGAALIGGLLTGFLRYEYVHWRVHFRAPRNPREARRRAHHLAHHLCNPHAYFGVSTRWWDLWLGTLPPEHARDYARVADVPPLTGPTNLGSLRPARSIMAPPTP